MKKYTEYELNKRDKARKRNNSEKEMFRGASRKRYAEKLYKRDVEPILKLPNEFRDDESKINPRTVDWMDNYFENHSAD